MSNEIVAVVVTYNRLTLLKECIEALLNQKKPCDIIIVNNNSDDGTREYIENIDLDHPTVSCIHLEENLGGAGGFHYGMKTAMERGYQNVWIMDDDTIVQQDALSALCEHQDLCYGFLSSKVVWTDGQPCKMNQQHILKDQTDNGMPRIDQASFVSLYFSREAVLQCGLPIKEYFIWGDDKEYTLRIAEEFPCYLIEDSVVVHKMNNNTGSNIKLDDVARIGRYYYAYRNDLATAKRRGGKEVAIYFAAFALNIIRIICSRTDAKGKRIAVMFRGMKAGIKFDPQIEYVR